MLRSRIIPFLLIHKGGLYKTINFKKHKYIGDPINAVRIFNEKEVDELIVVDIDASYLGNEPDYKLIKNLAIECRMPLCYGGGVKNVEQFDRIIGLGVEKVALSSAAVDNPDIIFKAVSRVGSQSVVGVIDVKKSMFLGRHQVLTHNGLKKTNLEPAKWAAKLQSLGVGEIIINSIDQDGKMEGYDLNIIDEVYNAISVPLTVLGGAGSIKDINALFSKYGIIGAAAGSFFVFKGKFRAVLINYPNKKEKIKYFK